jgi:tRNA A-37 threonylcarbamoyl transferase component Bud32
MAAVVGEVIDGRYALEELVGTGGMSSVYRARDTLLERDVALKILHESYLADDAAVERFRREARAVAQLSHPNIVTVIDRGEADGRQFIVFEYVPGKTLKDYVVGLGRLSVREALEIGIDVGTALDFAHRQGIVHRDVKPQNVILNGDGKPKVSDFGIARSLDVDHGVTQTGTVVGTSDYIAPEQADGRPVEPRTDMYSLGCVLYEALTGEVPFPGESFVAVAMRHIHEPPPSVLEQRPDVPVRVANAIERAMAKEPEERFPTMAAFVAELQACLDGLGEPDSERTMIVPGRVVRESRPRRVRPRRSAWPLVLVLAALGALVAALAVLALRDDDGNGGGNGGGAEAAGAQPVRIQGVGSYDPQGDPDGQEHPERVGDATDGDASTYWTTESYRASLADLGKQGVGLVLDTGRAVALAELAVRTDTPGYTAEVRVGPSATGPFDVRVSPGRQVGAQTRFPIEGRRGRYYLFWITALDRVAHVNEVTAKGRSG